MSKKPEEKYWIRVSSMETLNRIRQVTFSQEVKSSTISFSLRCPSSVGLRPQSLVVECPTVPVVHV